MKARLLYSEACKQKVSWDESIAGSIQSKWKTWIDGLPSLVNVRIKHWYDCTTPFQLPFFLDASSLARGTVCYVCSIFKDSVNCQMIMAKSRICNTKRTIVSRQELEAALDAVTLSRVVKQELELDSCQCFFWTDSTIVIQSLHAQCKRFSLFPRNRLLRILKHTKVNDWKFVPSELNPADKASRGLTTEELLRDKTRFDGPVFLSSSTEDWPKSPIPEKESEDVYAFYELTKKAPQDKEVNALSFNLASNTKILDSFIEFTPTTRFIACFSSLYCLKLATAWLLRFKDYLIMRVKFDSTLLKPSPMTEVHELQRAKNNLVICEQRVHFHEEIALLSKNKQLSKTFALFELDPILVDDLLRVGGRLDNAELSFDLKHSIILSETSHLTALIVEDTHCRLVGHAGVNSTLNSICQLYWIINARVCVKRIIDKCTSCKKRNSLAVNQVTADLPSSRLRLHEPPFSQVGIDYFGPLSVKLKRSEVKRYGCLFTCLTTRAIHLEVAIDLSTSSFINVLCRFVSRRGPVKHIFSDHGTNFVGCAHLMQESVKKWNQAQIHQSLQQMNVARTFNPPSASHMGGVWERMIRVVRNVLLAITPKQMLYDDDLIMLFTEVEAIVNFCPLTNVPLEAGEDTSLTPNHLLRLSPAVAPSCILTEKSDNYS